MKTVKNENDRANLIERLELLHGNEKALWGRMTVSQMISHLVQSGDLPFVASVADRSSFMSRTIIKPLVLYVLPMPKEVKTSPDIDQQENGRKPTEFGADKRLVIDSIKKLGDLSVDHNCLGHPFFGPMTTKHWAILSYKHIDHHLRQFGV